MRRPHTSASFGRGEAPLRATRLQFRSRSLLEVCEHLARKETLPRLDHGPRTVAPVAYPDLAEAKGQPQARRALEVAAAGRHSLLKL